MQNVLPIIRTSRVRIASFSLIPTANLLIASLECDTGACTCIYILTSPHLLLSQVDSMQCRYDEGV